LESLLTTAIGELVKALVDLAVKTLPEFRKKVEHKPAKGERFEDAIYDLYMQIQDLQTHIEKLIAVFDLIAANGSQGNDEADRILEKLLVEIRRTLAILQLDVKILRPRFEIHAAEAAPLVNDLDISEAEFVNGIFVHGGKSTLERIGLLEDHREEMSESERKAEAKQYLSELGKLREMAERARSALGTVILAHWVPGLKLG
jgi:hypothetical protein